MNDPAAGPAREMSDRDFDRLSSVIQDTLGIKMPISKKLMLQSRLMRRMRTLGLSSYNEYCDHVLHSEGEDDELIHLLDLATTNKTSFFRESDHFQFMLDHALPSLVDLPPVRASRSLSLWSAACSTGQEPYTLAMVVAEFLATHRLGDWDFTILATDISTRVLSIAKLGVYPESEADPIPLQLRRKYLLRGKGDKSGTVRVVPTLRCRVRFERMNLMHPARGIGRDLHVVMCRNALIYFEREKQVHIVRMLQSHLIPGGYLMLGMSESIHGYELPLVTVGRSVHQPAEGGARP